MVEFERLTDKKKLERMLKAWKIGMAILAGTTAIFTLWGVLDSRMTAVGVLSGLNCVLSAGEVNKLNHLLYRHSAELI